VDAAVGRVSLAATASSHIGMRAQVEHGRQFPVPTHLTVSNFAQPTRHGVNPFEETAYDRSPEESIRWLASGHTDMRKGFDRLALLV
jgi:hypothetical protein